jgi:hypothetical protein
LFRWLRSASGRAIYAVILWVVIFSTLEQFTGLSDDLLGPSHRAMFHLIVFLIAFAAALFEAITLRGLEGLRDYWDRPDPIAAVVNRKCTYRAALTADLPNVRKLALRRYGWAFPIGALQRWHVSNPRCLFLMLSDGELVGYIDAFPIRLADYQSLLAGGEERRIRPLRSDAVDATCSFYIASVVIAEAWGGHLPGLLRRAMTFYGASYPNKVWARVCAVGYSPEGRTMLERREAQPVAADDVKVRMYTVDRTLLPRLGKGNRAFWSKLLSL